MSATLRLILPGNPPGVQYPDGFRPYRFYATSFSSPFLLDSLSMLCLK